MNGYGQRATSNGQLLRILGVGFGLAVTIGNTIGSGILRTPGEIATHLKTPALFLGVWIVGGLYALLGAVSLAELGTMLPRSGGQYVFARRAIGDFAGFVVGWSDWISTCGSAAAASIVISEYGLQLLGFATQRGSVIAFASSMIALFVALQWQGMREGDRAQRVTALLKTLAFVVIVIAAFALGSPHTGSVSNVSTPLFLGIVIALQSVIFTYDGWTGPIYFSEEVRDAEKNIPRAMMGGVVSVIAIYLLVNVALLYLMPIEQMAGETLALGAAAKTIFGAAGDSVIRGLMIVSLLSALNAFLLMAPRVIFAMARDGLFSSRALRVNRGGTPTAALLTSGIIALLFVVSGTFSQVLALLAFFFVASYTISFASLFILRFTEPNMTRPYRAWGYPWTTGIALVGSVAFLVSAVVSDMRNSLWALAVLALSYPAFKLVVSSREPGAGSR